MKQKQTPQHIYRINEIFYSLQGEGLRVGTANIFIRFSGCNVNCSFCDTKHEVYSEMSIEDIFNDINQYFCKSVILTGGEPTLQNLKPLIDKFKKNDYFIAIETNGTNSIQGLNLDWITVSPKKMFLDGSFYKQKPNELKIIVQENNKISNWGFEYPILLQPESNKKECIDRCLRIIKQNPNYRLSLQMQKILKIR